MSLLLQLESCTKAPRSTASPRGKSVKTRALSLVISVAIFASALGCGGIKPIQPVKTSKIIFDASQEINNGKILPIDIVYITYAQELRQVARYGAEMWFEGKKRDEWKQKESVSIEGGRTVTVKLDPRVLERTVLLLVIADYENERDPSKQQVIIDYAGQDNELVHVKETYLDPSNKSLRYIE